MSKRKAIIQEEEEQNVNDSMASQDDDDEMDTTGEIDEREQERRTKEQLVKKVAHCILASSTKRGQCRDADIAEMFTDRNERALREPVLKRVEKLLEKTFGIKMERDEEGKRFYLYNNLKSDIGLRLAEKLEEARDRDEDHGDDDADEDRVESNLENAHFRHWLLFSTLMFIFMTKRHTQTTSETEKGVDMVLIKQFINGLFEKFQMRPLTEKQYGELMGPAKSAEFIFQGWLRCDSHTDVVSNITEVAYFWGPRAEKVVSKKEILQEFCNIYGGSYKDWPNHAKEAGYRNMQ